MKNFITENSRVFWELMRESIITQAAITIILVATVSVLALTGRPIPEIISSWGGVAIGFFFGAKFAQASKAK